ncbi:MAG TPA: rRNA maturation RNase YbeY, partial [Cyanobacteria bacterium UBA9273]|nr:rRNA maturation RNase YbeY [Cyanobacteria bacterium UBA9273]
MQVEVLVQDCFFSTSRSIPQGFEPLSNPIKIPTWERWFYQWLETLQPDITPRVNVCELTLRLTDDREIQALNAQYRHQNQPTDVLAFAALEVDSPQPESEMQLSLPLYLGDLVISVETAYRQAQQQGHFRFWLR